MSPEHKPFAHLHVHSEFSLLDGLSRINHLTQRAKNLNMPALALTDHGSMYGTIQFYRACKKAKIKPILGVEAYITAGRMIDRQSAQDRERFHLLLLAENQTGYQNLLKMVSSAWLDGHYMKPRIDHSLLEEHREGLITTTGCMAGEIPRAIQAGNLEKARSLFEWYLEVFGRDRFFVEMQEHSIPELTEINKTLIEMGQKYGVKFLATNDVHYTTAEEAKPHDILLCIQTSKSLNDQNRMRMSDQSYYLKSYSEMEKLFGNIPGALENSLLIAEMCDVDPEPKGYHLPQFDVPEGYTAESYLRHLCEKGLIWRFGEGKAADDAVLRQRLDHELSIIHNMGFDPYFLIVWDLCEFARSKDIWWNVRGSGAGSLVAYTLGITGIDPIANGLIFERFLNPDRVSMPDIDLDYPDDRRSEMIDYTIAKYGSDKVAQIITFGTLGARAAIRDVGRVLEVSLDEVDGIARLIPAIPGKPVSIADALDPEHEFYSSELHQRYKEDAQLRNLVATAQQLEGVARHASTHAAGVVISDRPLVDYSPLRRHTKSNGGDNGLSVVTQWPMEILDSIGLLKVDFLGLSTLTVLRKAAELIESRHGISYTMENIPYDVGQIGPDPDKKPEKLFDMLGRGEVAGVFQVEGAGMRRLMIQMKPKRFDNIIAAISLYRPGPMDNIPEYISRMHGSTKVVYQHPDLEPILQDTYGILVYQEQIIRIAADLAGYSPGEADMIRKAVAKKKQALMDKHRVQFLEGALARGYSKETLNAIWGDIEFFARYGFNKAHAADYAVITCQTAFLKAHYPVEYMAALLSVERNNSDKVALYLAEARRMKIDVAPPHINKADLDFSIEGNDSNPVIRYGLGAIKNAGVGAIELMIDERHSGGEFKDIADLCERVDLRKVGKRALESMIKVSVFEGLGSRSQLLEALDRIVGHSGKIHDAANVGQMSLFGGEMAGTLNISLELLKPVEDVPDIDQHDVLNWEKELIGVYISEHPVTRYLPIFEDTANATTVELETLPTGRPITMIGLLTHLRTHITKKGQSMAFGTIEDLHGNADVILFPRIWETHRSKVKVNQVYLVRGKVQLDRGDRVNVIVDSIDNNISMPHPIDSEETNTIPEVQDIGIMNTFGTDNKTVQPTQNKNQELPNSPVPPVNDSKIRLEKSTPEPPPNFEEEKSDASEDQATDTSHSSSNGNHQKQSNDYDMPPKIETADSDQLNQAHRMIEIKITPDYNWRESCRDVVAIADKFQGHDSLRISIIGQTILMDFPSINTHFCPELVNEIENLPAVVSSDVKLPGEMA